MLYTNSTECNQGNNYSPADNVNNYNNSNSATPTPAVFRDHDITVIVNSVLYFASKKISWPQTVVCDKIANHFSQEEINEACNILSDLGFVPESRPTRSHNKSKNNKARITTLVKTVRDTLSQQTSVIITTTSTDLPTDHTAPKKNALSFFLENIFQKTLYLKIGELNKKKFWIKKTQN